MNPQHLKYLVCPKTKETLILKNPELENGKIKSGILISSNSNHEYPIVNFIPRFVDQGNYAANFGLEWNIHNRTQYDDTSGYSASAERFEKETKWGKDLKGELVLEAGSGSGRFTCHAVKTGAMVISFDYSSAVEANYKSNGQCENLLIIQASIYEMPFSPGYFDKLFCFGVIQHTPNPRQTFNCLVEAVKPGGKISTDIYLKSFIKTYTSPKHFIRNFTKNSDPEKLYKKVKNYINFIWPLARILAKIPKIGKWINWRIMVADYSDLLKNADDKTLKEWAVLDTYDMLSPAYDYPQTLKTFKRWHTEAGLTEIDVYYGYNGVEGRGQKSK